MPLLAQTPLEVRCPTAFMFESRCPQRVTAYAANSEQLQRDYGAYGKKLRKLFDPKRP